MKIRVITSPEAVAGEADKINALFAEGLHCLHLRKPDWPEGAVESLLEAVLPQFRGRVVLHNHFALAAAYRIRGVHFPESYRLQLSGRELERVVEQWHKGGKTVSTSVHTWPSLLNLYPAFDEVLVGPVFESISKAGYQPAENWDVRDVREKVRFKLVGLGGMEASTMAAATTLGFTEVAVLGAIWNEPEGTLAQFRQLQEAGKEI